MNPPLITVEQLLNAGLPSDLTPILRSRLIVVTLIGSSRFKDAHIRAMREMTLLNFIVIPLGLYGHVEGLDMEGPWKSNVDLLHLDKIDISHIVYVVNPGGYLGKSTRSEIAYARSKGKCLIFMEGGAPDG